jgi:hypothetical protein
VLEAKPPVKQSCITIGTPNFLAQTARLIISSEVAAASALSSDL